METLYNLFSFYTPEEIKAREEIHFYIHDKEHRLKTAEFSPQTSLNDYIRKNLYLTGTKEMCREGGCGVCIVAATTKHPVTKQEVTFTVNSCLVALFSCHDWRITTIEGVSEKNPEKPDVPVYHKTQEALVKFSGTQCGFCSSGMIITMHTLLKNNPNITMKEIEDSFGGNICRCTGYRPILSAFKSLASDADKELLGSYPDIEDALPCKMKGECKEECKHLCQQENTSFCLYLGDQKWYKVYKLSEIMKLFNMYPQSTHMLVSGNTAKGVYPNPSPKQLYVDITSVEELLSYTLTTEKLVLGANMSLTQVMQLFYKIGAEQSKFSYLTKMADHIDLIATVPVRNIGSLAGNLTTKHDHHEFPSDVFLILETARATITIIDTQMKESIITVAEYINTDMARKVMTKITLRSLDEKYKYESYKIMPRAQNAHAMVNAGFLLQFDNDTVMSANIVYGAINPTFIHAKNTEDYLKGKNIFDNSILQGAMKILDGELSPDWVKPDPRPEFRKKLAVSLFYKYILSIANIKVSPRNKSGSEKLTRPISKGTQDFETKESLYPLTQPIAKLEAYAQVSGRAEYINDMTDKPGQLYGALVLAKAKPYSIIASINKQNAMKVPGVVAYFDKNDLPGKNSFTAGPYMPIQEELFCSGTVKHYNQPVGIVIAESQDLAEKAADLIEIQYTLSGTKPLFTVREVLEYDKSRLTAGSKVEPKKTGNDVKHVVKGSYQSGLQYHYHMETQCCSVIPIEDGLDVYPSTQYMDLIQSSIAENLNIDANKINIYIRRLGGAYGAKISRNGLFTNAAALASYKLQRPVKIWSPFPTNMDVAGKRCPLTADYEAGLNNDGILQYLTITFYSDYGYEGGNEDMIAGIISLIQSGYITDTFKITSYSVKTDMATNTWCRAPGTTEGLGLIESIFEHISYAINMDPIQLRLANMNRKDHPRLYDFYKDTIDWADVYGRRIMVEKFNKENRWRKKGISVIPMAYTFYPFGYWNVLVSIYNIDGTVSISHGGVEMGQGLNTKVAQACAFSFGIPVDKIKIKPNYNMIAANSLSTGGSVTSESICFAVTKASEIIKERMKPVRAKLDNPTWREIVAECYTENISLSALYLFNPNEVSTYMIYSCCAVEVEVDILTGLHQISRVDIWEDTGDSISPLVDIGQVEGAFVMGQGLWTTEEIVIGDEGQVLSNRTWTYKPPGAKDIPIDFRVKFPKNNPNPLGVLNSKATAEPPLCLTCCIPLAIRNAVGSARSETGNDIDKWYPLDGPSTVENTYLNCLHDYKQYTL